MVFSGSVLAVTVTVLVCFVPACPLDGVNTTSILPLCPILWPRLGVCKICQNQRLHVFVLLPARLCKIPANHRELRRKKIALLTLNYHFV